jgi:hypothetical protein
MSLKNLLFAVICLLHTSVRGQFRDTSLHTLYSRPFFYNVVKGEDGKIYAGTSEGIHRLDGSLMIKIDGRTGYLTQDAKGRLVIDSNGIKYHDQKSYVRLLPFPTESRDEYHAGTDDFFYITSSGRMHIYEILPFEHRYRNHSVRTASRNFVGTYSGIYYRGRKLSSPAPFPGFTDGRIRELNGKVFMCYSTLLIADLHEGDSLPRPRPELPTGYDFKLVTDILYSTEHKRYFAAGNTDLVAIDTGLAVANTVYTTKEKDREVILLGEGRELVYFAAGRDFMSYDPVSSTNKVSATLAEPILDGHIGNLSHHLLGNRGLYVVHTDGRTNKLTDLQKAHTLLSLGGSDFAISTDAGLFLYNTVSNRLSVLIRGVEFNRRGLYLQGDTLYAGSIDGLYVLDAKNLEQLAERMSKVSKKQAIPSFILPLLIGLVLLAAVLSYLLYRSRSRLNRIIEETRAAEPNKTTREDIETYIRENLAQASLKSIAEKFQTNNAIIYALLAPDKPGAIINRLRMEQVHKLRKENRPARDISQLTGFSEYYVRKVWNTKE